MSQNNAKIQQTEASMFNINFNLEDLKAKVVQLQRKEKMMNDVRIKQKIFTALNQENTRISKQCMESYREMKKKKLLELDDFSNKAIDQCFASALDEGIKNYYMRRRNFNTQAIVDKVLKEEYEQSRQYQIKQSMLRVQQHFKARKKVTEVKQDKAPKQQSEKINQKEPEKMINKQQKESENVQKVENKIIPTASKVQLKKQSFSLFNLPQKQANKQQAKEMIKPFTLFGKPIEKNQQNSKVSLFDNVKQTEVKNSNLIETQEKSTLKFTSTGLFGNTSSNLFGTKSMAPEGNKKIQEVRQNKPNSISLFASIPNSQNIQNKNIFGNNNLTNVPNIFSQKSDNKNIIVTNNQTNLFGPKTDSKQPKNKQTINQSQNDNVKTSLNISPSHLSPPTQILKTSLFQ